MAWPDLRALELLVAVGDYGSLSAAADVCGVAQPNVTRTLARLEATLGLTLLVRSQRGSTLTDEGRQVAQQARALLEQARAFHDATVALVGHQSVPVSASQTVADYLLPGWLAQLKQSHPGVTVHVRVGNSTQVVESLLAGRARLGFIEAPTVPSGLHSEVVGSDDMVVVVSPEHAWAGRSIDAATLASTALIVREPTSGTRKTVDQALSAWPRVEPALELVSNAAIRISARSGVAPAVLSRRVVASDIAAGDLVEVPVTDLALTRHFTVVWLGPRHVSGAAEALLDVVRATQEDSRAGSQEASSRGNRMG